MPSSSGHLLPTVVMHSLSHHHSDPSCSFSRHYSSFVLRLSSCCRRRTIVVLQLLYIRYRVVMMPSRSFHRCHSSFVIQLSSCRHHTIVVVIAFSSYRSHATAVIASSYICCHTIVVMPLWSFRCSFCRLNSNFVILLLSCHRHQTAIVVTLLFTIVITSETSSHCCHVITIWPSSFYHRHSMLSQSYCY